MSYHYLGNLASFAIIYLVNIYCRSGGCTIIQRQEGGTVTFKQGWGSNLTIKRPLLTSADHPALTRVPRTWRTFRSICRNMLAQ